MKHFWLMRNFLTTLSKQAERRWIALPSKPNMPRDQDQSGGSLYPAVNSTRSYPLTATLAGSKKNRDYYCCRLCFHCIHPDGLMLRFGNRKYYVVVLRRVNTKNLEEGEIHIRNLASLVAVVVYFPHKNWNMAKI